MHSTTVLCVNSGSSSLKLALFAVDGSSERRIADGSVDRIGHAGGRIVVRAGTKAVERVVDAPEHDRALELLLEALVESGAPEPSAVGHRVVHGGPRHVVPVQIDETVLADLEACVPLAPLHMPPALAAIRTVSARFPDRVQVACFDTAFHAGLPEVTRRLPLPARFVAEGIRRYGFHGLSYEYVVSTLRPDVPKRTVIAHLGNGASLVALEDGRPVDTTMGLTPTGGVVMATRSGDLDPGALVWLLREGGLSVAELEHLVNYGSGLAAIARTGDMRTLLERASTDADASLAVDTFVYSVKKAIGAYIAALGGIDLLVFTGGIGENASSIRELVCRGLHALGIDLDREANRAARGNATISSKTSNSTVKVVATDEDRMIARHVRRFIDVG
jgi:acetate kinase